MKITTFKIVRQVAVPLQRNVAPAISRRVCGNGHSGTWQPPPHYDITNRVTSLWKASWGTVCAFPKENRSRDGGATRRRGDLGAKGRTQRQPQLHNTTSRTAIVYPSVLRLDFASQKLNRITCGGVMRRRANPPLGRQGLTKALQHPVDL